MTKDVISVIETLKKHTHVIILGKSNKALLAITPEYGAKVMAISVNGLKSSNLIWPNPEIFSEKFWSGEKLNWNLGGARSWISPEADFYLDEKQKWFVPENMDPGNYQLISQDENVVVCSNEFDLYKKKNKHII